MQNFALFIPPPVKIMEMIGKIYESLFREIIFAPLIVKK